MQDFTNSLVPLYIGNFKSLDCAGNVFIKEVLISERGFWAYDIKNSQLYITNGELAYILNNKDDISKQVATVLNPQEYDYLVKTTQEAISSKEKGFSLKITLLNGEWVLVSAVILYKNGEPGKIIGIFESITSSMTSDVKYSRYLELLAYYDDVIRLPNRNYISEVIKDRIEKFKKINSSFWIIFIEIRNFGFINEIFGHTVGDEFLKSVSFEIKKAIPREWILGRFGGDELVIVTTCAKKQVIIEKTLELIDRFSKNWQVMGKTFFANINIGIAGYPEDGKNVSELLKNAEAALTWAKRRARDVRKSQYELYSPRIAEYILNRLELESEILKGIQKKQFFLVYQPKFSIDTHKVMGFEALLRWNSDKGILSPNKFINLAEESGLIYELNKFVFDVLCNDINFFKEEGLGSKRIAVNLSGKEFAFYNMVANLNECLKKHNITPSDVEIEITERTILSDIELSKSVFKKLSDLGIKISIDDFGTGFSSLELLLTLPINALKIDKKFIDQIEYFENEYIITKNIIYMAKELNLKTVAEGVERVQQYDILKDLGCDEVQGYLFAKPMNVDEVVAFLKGRI